VKASFFIQNSKFLQFVSKMSRGELIIDDNQIKPATSDWADEYQAQYTAGPSSWADQFAKEQVCVLSELH
jgi:peroxin-5